MLSGPRAATHIMSTRPQPVIHGEAPSSRQPSSGRGGVSGAEAPEGGRPRAIPDRRSPRHIGPNHSSRRRRPRRGEAGRESGAGPRRRWWPGRRRPAISCTPACVSTSTSGPPGLGRARRGRRARPRRRHRGSRREGHPSHRSPWRSGTTHLQPPRWPPPGCPPSRQLADAKFLGLPSPFSHLGNGWKTAPLGSDGTGGLGHGRHGVQDGLREWYEAFGKRAAANPDMTLEVMREAFEQIHQVATEAPGVSYADDDADGVPVLWALPAGGAQDRVILYFHGGGFVFGSRYSHRKLAGHLANAAGVPVAVVEYRLAPEHPFPRPSTTPRPSTGGCWARTSSPGTWPPAATRRAATCAPAWSCGCGSPVTRCRPPSRPSRRGTTSR